MAHFAELDEYGYVTRVVVIANEEILDDGVEQESLGIARCQELYGHDRWVQTSYNGNIRGRYAGVGLYYDRERDEFR